MDPTRLVSEALGRRGDAVYVRSVSAASRREFVFAPGRLKLIAAGKAAVPMAAAAHGLLGTRVDDAIVIAPKDTPFDGLPAHYRRTAAGHPHPDAESAAGGAAALTSASSLVKGDLLLVLLSGGGSSLMAVPAGGLTLAEKSKTIALLMAAGAPIADVNLVRGCLSLVKAGGLARAAGLADVVTLVLSDLGDEGWHLVASGPTMGVPTSPAAALAILDRYRLTPLVPPAVRAFLSTPRTRLSPRPTGDRWHILLADIRTALDGARISALRLGAEARIVHELLSGEARAAGRRLALAGASAGNLLRHPLTRHRRLVTIFGGETTVTIKGPGRGGRNRELALATAYPIAGVPGACVLVAGTDGVDYGPEAAGAFVDDTTLTRAEALGLDPGKALRDNDSGPFFEKLGDAFSPGPTGTNVGDVAFVLAPGGEDGEPLGGAESSMYTRANS